MRTVHTDTTKMLLSCSFQWILVITRGVWKVAFEHSYFYHQSWCWLSKSSLLWHHKGMCQWLPLQHSNLPSGLYRRAGWSVNHNHLGWQFGAICEVTNGFLGRLVMADQHPNNWRGPLIQHMLLSLMHGLAVLMKDNEEEEDEELPANPV